MTTTSGLGKIALTLFLAACCVLPEPVSAATARAAAKPKPRATRSHSRHRYVPREKAVNPTLGDIADFDDPLVRAAAVEALKFSS